MCILIASLVAIDTTLLAPERAVAQLTEISRSISVETSARAVEIAS
jgi:hypothetical protein